jgi:hypothetical protein
MDLDDLDDILLLVAYKRRKKRVQRMRSGQPGQEYVKELLDSAHPERVHHVLRMQLATFYGLRDWLLANTNLKGDIIVRNQRIRGYGKQVSIEEKLAIFIHISSRGASNRDTSERFSRGGRTISRYALSVPRMLFCLPYSCFHEVLDALLILYSYVVNLPASDTPLSPRIADNPKYTPYFDDCIGALDGTHIAAYVPITEQARYRNRKGTLSQNVLAVCNFDMQFVYVLPGWEGSAYDGRVLLDAQSRHGFCTQKGKYWLGDAGYGNSEYIMSPYRGVRYHLKEQRLADKK